MGISVEKDEVARAARVHISLKEGHGGVMNLPLQGRTVLYLDE